MVTKIVKSSKREKFNYEKPEREKYSKTETDLANELRKYDDSEYMWDQRDTDNESRMSYVTSLKYEKENATKESKPKKFVSFSDDGKSPFTSSIYYGVKSYLHHFYEPLNRTSYNGENLLVRT